VIGITMQEREMAQAKQSLSYLARAFNPAHPDLARSAGVPAQLANEAYVEALARVVYTGRIRPSTSKADTTCGRS
jgi:hypothetical protein